MTRRAGKIAAIINTVWLILSSLLQFVGAYNNCWCQGNAFVAGDNGWVVLFKDAPEMSLVAQPYWAGGLAMTLGVCVLSYGIFALAFVK